MCVGKIQKNECEKVDTHMWQSGSLKFAFVSVLLARYSTCCNPPGSFGPQNVAQNTNTSSKESSSHALTFKAQRAVAFLCRLHMMPC